MVAVLDIILNLFVVRCGKKKDSQGFSFLYMNKKKVVKAAFIVEVFEQIKNMACSRISK